MKFTQDYIKSVLADFRPELILLAISGAILLGAVIVFVLIPQSKPQEGSGMKIVGESTQNLGQNTAKIFVDVSGAVVAPDVYEASVGARIKDIIVMAKGLSAAADRDYVAKNLNLAQTISDQQKIYIPTKEEVRDGYQESTVKKSITRETYNSAGTIGLIDINNATPDELDTLPGVGPATAAKIIQGRPYGAVEEIKDRKVVNARVYESISDKVFAQ